MISWTACDKKNKTTSPGNDSLYATIKYNESPDDFPNPERGFYRYSEARASNYVPLQESMLRQWRELRSADGGNYQVYSTLVFRYFVMDIFKNGPLSEIFLQAVKRDFDIARSAGVKLIPRFVYTTSVTSGNCNEGFICPPYGDAPKNIILLHLSQLKPVLKESADVIAVVQMGLIGTWGENYYTDYFGDASSNGQRKLIDSDWSNRNEIIKALLDAVPVDRMIQVRYPQIKQRYLDGVNAPVTQTPMTDEDAFNNSERSRIGYHNDCLLASNDDYGTYEDYGNSSSPRQSANSILRIFKKADSKYVAVGGETCDDNYSPQNDCEPAGMAETELAAYHYSYLNCAYNNTVNNDWQTNGCMLNIRKKLGYRFVLKELSFPKDVKVGTEMTLSFTINNIGYASPFNERPVNLIFKNKLSGQEIVFRLETDIRKWFSGTHKLDFKLKTGSEIIPGEYELFLHMPDKYSTISSRSEYAIRLANRDLWVESTGYNKLLANVVVK